MATSPPVRMIQHLRRAVLRRELAALSDGQLLGHYIEHRDEAAFEALVRRHGPMVLGVCRRILGNAHDADDRFKPPSWSWSARPALSCRAKWLRTGFMASPGRPQSRRER